MLKKNKTKYINDIFVVIFTTLNTLRDTFKLNLLFITKFYDVY